MPSRAKTTMKRKSRNSKLMMDFIELRRDTTRFRRDAQYLTGTHAHVRRSTEDASVAFKTSKSSRSGNLLSSDRKLFFFI